MNTRRSFLSKSLLAAAGSMLVTPAISQEVKKKLYKNDLPSLEGKKVLFVYGGWDGHEPEKFKTHFTTWLKDEGASVTVSDTLDIYLDESLMSSLDLIIQLFTMSEITKEQEKGLLKAVKNGAGMAGWHGGMNDAFRTNVAYQFMTGGQWVAHPGNIIEYTVNITDKKDPLTKGLKDFKMKSEQYYMHIDPNVNVLATTTFSGEHAEWIDGCVMPVVWKKMYGKGRIFYTSLGHNLSHITDVPEAEEIIKRGIKWASASKYEPAEEWVSPAYPKS